MSVLQNDAACTRQEQLSRKPASYRTGEIILCECGSSWKVIRKSLPSTISEHMACLCGVTLLSWCEAADYCFEAIEPEDI